MFVTIFLGILDTATGEVLYSNAGHNPPLIIAKDGKAEFLSVTPGLVTGAFENFEYVTGRLVLKEGETVFMCTDGVTEAMNPSDELFSEERLLQSLVALSRRPIGEMIGRLTENHLLCAGYTSFGRHNDDGPEIHRRDTELKKIQNLNVIRIFTDKVGGSLLTIQILNAFSQTKKKIIKGVFQ